MHSKNAAWCLLRQIINGAPQAGYMQIPLMESDHQQVCVVIAQEFDDRSDLPPIEEMGAKFDSRACGQGVRLLLDLFIEFEASVIEQPHDSGIGRGDEGRIGWQIAHDCD
jgi:hypothetical protein